MIFGFKLYTVSLQVILVAYFGRVLGELRRLRLLEDDEVYYYQY